MVRWRWYKRRTAEYGSSTVQCSVVSAVSAIKSIQYSYIQCSTVRTAVTEAERRMGLPVCPGPEVRTAAARSGKEKSGQGWLTRIYEHENAYSVA